MDVTTQTFDREAIEASQTTPVVVDIWAPWCGPGGAFETHGDRVKRVKVNSDDNTHCSRAFNIRSIPNVIAFKNGSAVAQFTGAENETARTRLLALFTLLADETTLLAEYRRKLITSVLH